MNANPRRCCMILLALAIAVVNSLAAVHALDHHMSVEHSAHHVVVQQTETLAALLVHEHDEHGDQTDCGLDLGVGQAFSSDYVPSLGGDAQSIPTSLAVSQVVSSTVRLRPFGRAPPILRFQMS